MNTLADGAVWAEGRITPPAEARVPAMDHGFLYGDSVYEVVRTLDGLPVAWPEHFERLTASARAIYMDLPWPREEIGTRVRATQEATGLQDVSARIVVTRGPGPMSLLPDGCDGPRLVIFALPLRGPIAAQTEHGIEIAVPKRLRNDQRALAPAAKTGNYLNNLLALVEAQRAGGVDAVLLNVDGHVTEGTTSNVFWVRGSVVRTASLDCGILSGITRHALLDALRAERIPVEEGGFPLEDLTGADEAFLTGTVRGVTPVVRIDGRPVGTGVPGPMTRRVSAVNDAVLRASRGPW